MEILGRDGAKRPKLNDSGVSREELAKLVAQMFPTDRRKNVEREWDLSVDEARSVVEGSASQRTIDKILKHENGGWKVALPLLGAVIGTPIHTFIASEKQRLIDEAERYRREADELASAEAAVARALPSGVARALRVVAGRDGASHRRPTA